MKVDMQKLAAEAQVKTMQLMPPPKQVEEKEPQGRRTKLAGGR
jgi:hypothetical protein